MRDQPFGPLDRPTEAVSAILFDLDGVLMHSLEANHAFYGEVLSGLGYGASGLKDVASVFHMSECDALATLSCERDPELLELVYNAAKTRRFPTELLRLPVGDIEVIDRLSRCHKLGIVTNSTRANVEDYFKLSGSRACFSAVMAFEDLGVHKPNPEPLWRALETLAVDASRAAYVGDSPGDALAAKRAGIRIIRFGGESRAGPADVQTFAELLSIFETDNEHR